MLRSTASCSGLVPAEFRRGVRAATAIVLAVFLLMATYGQPWKAFDRGPYTADFYDEQAHSLVHGHLDVDERVASLEGFRHDGKTYLYFGIVPALFHAPTAFVTDALDGRLVIVSMLAALALALWATGRLVWRARVWTRGDAPMARRDVVTAVVFIGIVGLSSPLLFLSARALVYHEAIAWGVAFTLLTFECLLAWSDAPSWRSFAFAVAAAVGALNSRSSVGLGAALALLAFVALRLSSPRWSRRDVLVGLAVALAPFVLYVAVNEARFGNPTTIPFNAQGINEFDPHRREMLARNHDTIVGLQFVPTTLVDYLRPDGIRLQRLLPWITYRHGTTVVGDVEFDTLDRSGSVPVEAPALFILAVVGAVALARRRWNASRWVVLAVAALAGVGPTLAIGFTANRYLADFVPVLLVLGGIGAWLVADHRVGRRAVVTAAVAGALVVTALTIQSQRLFLLPRDQDRRAFIDLQYRVDNALFGSRHPAATHRGSVLPSPTEEQSVFIVGSCDALYWSDGHGWFQLEGAPDTSLCDQLDRRFGSNS